MSLRKMLGADVRRVHEQVDALLDGEDAMIVLVDGSRAISYAHGFAASPDQLELLASEIERAVRSVAGPPMNSLDDSGRGSGLRRDRGRLVRAGNGGVVDWGSESVRTGSSADRNTGGAAGRVFRLAREATATDAR